MCYDEKKRQVIKRGAGVPTIPVSTDHRNGDWIDTDIYEGELYMDTNTGQTYTRSGATIITAGKGSENFANADLTFTGTRTHDLDGFGLGLINGAFGFDTTGIASTGISFSGDQTGISNSTVVIENTASGEALVVNNGIVRFINTPTYADEAAAVTAGLLNGTIYKTATGELRIKL